MGYKKIIEIKEIVVEQASRVERMLQGCCGAIIESNQEILEEIIEKQEYKVNKKEIKIDKIITNVLALYHPEAKELRYVVMMLRMNYDLERMADRCVDIAKALLSVREKTTVTSLFDIDKLLTSVLSVVHESINSFVNEDIDLAIEVIERESESVKMASKSLRELLKYMACEQQNLEIGFQIADIIKSLERIASLSTNICEATVYIVDGKIIRHHKFQEYIEQRNSEGES